MFWNNPVGMETPARLYIGKILIATIKKRPAGRLPFYFSQKIILTYSGSFGSLKTAKRHAEVRLRAFALSILNTPKKTA
jgi:hypothetical protein